MPKKPAPPRPPPPRSTPALPKNWPTSLPYLSAPHTASLPAALHAHLNLSAHAPCRLVRIRRITTPSHPAAGQHGLFAARRLAANSFVLPYFGRYHTSAATDTDSDYDVWLDRELDVAVDARWEGNEGRFVNDYRGVTGRANAEFRVEGGAARRVEVWTVRKVERGEELCVSYGKGFWEGRKRGVVDVAEEEKKQTINKQPKEAVDKKKASGL